MIQFVLFRGDPVQERRFHQVVPPPEVAVDPQAGYGIVTEVGYVALGSDVVLLMLPGEVSPALVYGTDETFTGTDSWQGENSWSGKDWQYRTLEDMVRESSGDSDKQVLVMGVRPNNALQKQLEEKGVKVIAVGDAAKGGTIGHAVHDAFNKALLI